MVSEGTQGSEAQGDHGFGPMLAWLEQALARALVLVEPATAPALRCDSWRKTENSAESR